MSEEQNPEERAQAEIEAAKARAAAEEPESLTTSEAVQTWVWVLVAVVVLMGIAAGVILGFLGGRIGVGRVDYTELLGATLVDRGGEVVLDPVYSPGAAETAGLRTGDELISIDATSINSAGQAQRLIESHRRGETIRVVVRSQGRISQVTVTLGVYEVVIIPTPLPPTVVVVTVVPIPQQNLSEARMGVRYRMILPDDPFEIEQGAMILTVLDPSGPAARAGLAEGDVIVSVEGDTLSEFYTLQDALTAFEPGDRVRMRVWRDGRTMTVTVTMGG